MTRLMAVNGSLTEEINGAMRTFAAGEVFEHPDDERAKRLLSITPAIVEAVGPVTPKPVAVASAKPKTAPKP